MMGIKVRLVMAGMLAAVALGAMGAPGAEAAASTCRVRNVTQATADISLRRMVAAARDGDRLTVRGTCRMRGVKVVADIVIRGADGSVLDARGSNDPLTVKPGAKATVENLTIRDARSDSGAIRNRGTLHLEDVRILDNDAVFASGINNEGTIWIIRSVVSGNHAKYQGPIFNSGWMTIVDSVVRGNQSGRNGGAIANRGTISLLRTRVVGNGPSTTWHEGGGGLVNAGIVTLADSVIRGNRNLDPGGGIVNTGVLTLIDSVVRDNVAPTGGGIWNEATARLVRSSITGNTAQTTGGGVKNAGGALRLDQSVISGNAVGATGGGILNEDGGAVTLENDSSVTGNTPDDCVGTTAC